MIRRQPRSARFPYTTLFRSRTPMELSEEQIAAFQEIFPLNARPLQPQDLRSKEHTSELQSPCNLVCRLLLEKKKTSRRHDAVAVAEMAVSAQLLAPARQEHA